MKLPSSQKHTFVIVVICLALLARGSLWLEHTFSHESVAHRFSNTLFFHGPAQYIDQRFPITEDGAEMLDTAWVYWWYLVNAFLVFGLALGYVLVRNRFGVRAPWILGAIFLLLYTPVFNVKRIIDEVLFW